MKSASKRNSQIHGILMFLPYFVLLSMWAIYPLALALYTSFQPSRTSPSWGLGNYLFALTDFRFLPAVINVVSFLLL
ncbi:MAG: hypothetical protein ACPG20_02380, partial [Pontimonas sp.]